METRQAVTAAWYKMPAAQKTQNKVAFMALIPSQNGIYVKKEPGGHSPADREACALAPLSSAV